MHSDLAERTLDHRPVLALGDSHCLFFRGVDTIFDAPFRHAGIDVLHLSAASARRFIMPDDRFRWLAEKAFHSNKYGAIIFSIGYLDCRSHIIRMAEKSGNSIESEAADLADRYVETVQKTALYGDAKVVFLCPPASVSIGQHPSWDISGSTAERNRASVAFAARLKGDAGTGFVDTHDFTMTADLLTRDDALYDKVHLKSDHLPLVLGRLRSELSRLGNPWTQQGGGDFKLACHPKEIERAMTRRRIAARQEPTVLAPASDRDEAIAG